MTIKNNQIIFKDAFECFDFYFNQKPEPTMTNLIQGLCDGDNRSPHANKVLVHQLNNWYENTKRGQK